MDRDARQAQHLLERGALPRALLEEALRVPRDPLQSDLCALLLGRHLITTELAREVRERVSLEMSGGFVSPPAPPLNADSSGHLRGLTSTPPTPVQTTPPPGNPLTRSTRHDLTRSSRSDARVPERLAGCDIEREIARGGMGVVYLAHHPQHPRPVAIKVLLNAKGTSLERFEVEVAAARRLKHPHIVRVLGAGEEDGHVYMIMDFIDGESLDRTLARKGSIDPDTAAEWTLAIAEGLAHAHEQGVLHRDLKPPNVIVTRADPPQVLLTDFGLARLVDDQVEALTLSGEMIGTPQYMPPEQAEGKRERIDERSDVYSLGATLYEMLTGAAPFAAPTMIDLIVAVTMNPPKPPRERRPHIPAELEAICLKCLEKDPEDRYQSVAELIDDLERYRLGDVVEAAPAEAGAPLWPFILAALVVAALAVGGWLALRPQVDDPAPAPPPAATAGTVRLTSAPSGIAVQLEGPESLRVTTPAALELEPGRYRVRIADPRFLDVPLSSSEVEVEAGVALDLEVQAKARKGTLSLPFEDASLRVAGRLRGGEDRFDESAPFELELEPGVWELTLTHPELAPRDQAVELRAGESFKLSGHLPARVRWALKLPGRLGPPLICDLDGDAQPELAVVLNPGRVLVFDAAGGLVSRFEFKDTTLSPQLNAFDFDDDGVRDLLLAGHPERVLGFASIVSEKGQIGSNMVFANLPFTRDLDGDGRDELVFQDKAGKAVFCQAGKLDAVRVHEDVDGALGPPTFLDIDADGISEVLWPSAKGALYAFRLNGNLIWKEDIGGTLALTLAADFDPSRPGLELAVATKTGDSGQVTVLTAMRERLWSRAVEQPPARLEVLNREGRAALLIYGSKDQAYALEGAQAEAFRLDLRREQEFRCLDAGDLDGDGVDELALGVGKRASVYSAEGQLLWSRDHAGEVLSVDLVDLDRDERPELITADTSGHLKVFVGHRGRIDEALPGSGSAPERTPFHAGPYHIGPDLRMIERRTSDTHALSVVGETSNPIRTAPFPMTWDAESGKLLFSLNEAIQSWQAAPDNPVEALVQGGAPTVARRVGEVLITATANGEVVAWPWEHDAKTKPIWVAKLRGRVEVPPMPVPEAAGPPGWFVVTSAAQAVLLSPRGEIRGTLDLPGAVRAAPLDLEDGRVLVASQNGWLTLLELRQGILARVRELDLGHALRGPPTLVRGPARIVSCAVPTAAGLVVTDPEAERILGADLAGGQHAFGVAAAELDGEPGEEIAVSMFQSVEHPYHTPLFVYSDEGALLARVNLGETRHLPAQGEAERLWVSGAQIVTLRPWPNRLVPAAAYGRTERALLRFELGAYALALDELGRIPKRTAQDQLLSALARWHLGERGPLEALKRDNPEAVRAIGESWAKVLAGRPSVASHYVRPLDLVLPPAPSETPVSGEMSAPPGPGGLRKIDLAADPPKGLGFRTFSFNRPQCGFRAEDRSLGLILRDRGVITASFEVTAPERLALRLLHRALPHYSFGGSAITIRLDGQVIHRHWGVPWWGPGVAEAFDLGALEPGTHRLEVEAEERYPTVYSLQAIELHRQP